MSSSVDQFQAYAHVNNGEYQYWNPVGSPQGSEALAWREVHNVGIQFWPESAPRRRLFETKCKVTRITRVQVK
jgi:hypothetical protein